MKLNKEDLLLYGVTDSKYLKGRKMSELVEEAILGGVTMIQLREKEMTHEAFKQEALDVQSVCQKHHVPLIINDDVELCKEIDADGVHIGQDDLNLKEARKILGEDKIIGVSAHNYEEAKIALENGADYLGVGAIFTTQTKDDAQNISMDTLNEICQKTNLKLFVSLDKPCVKSDYNIVEWESEKVGKKRRDNGYLRLVYDKGAIA